MERAAPGSGWSTKKKRMLYQRHQYVYIPTEDPEQYIITSIASSEKNDQMTGGVCLKRPLCKGLRGRSAEEKVVGRGVL